MSSREVSFRYRGREFHMQLLDTCSVSDAIASRETFYELEFLEALERVLPKGCVVFDVGAHIGNHTVYFASMLDARVVAFEPNPAAFSLLQGNVGRNGVGEKVILVDTALSDTAGRHPMGMIDESDAGTYSMEGLHPDRWVRAARLDDFIHLAEPGCTYVKVDVERHEVSVLRGARRFLAEIEPRWLSVEVGAVAAYDEIRQELPDYFPLGVFNATPTVLFERDGGADRRVDPAFDIARYAVDSAVLALYHRAAARRALSPAMPLGLAVEPVASEKGGQAGVSRVVKEPWSSVDQETVVRALRSLAGAAQDSGSLKYVRQISEALELWADRGGAHARRGGAHVAKIAGARLLVATFGDGPTFPIVLSAYLGRVDVLELSRDGSNWNLMFNRFVKGESIGSEARTVPVELPTLVAWEALEFSRAGEGASGSLDLLLVVGGETDWKLRQLLIDAFRTRYVLVAQDAVYRFDSLRAELGASACLWAGEGAIDDWEARHPRPIEAANMEGAGDVLGHVSDVLAAPLEGVPALRGSDEIRVLIVSYFAPPARLVSTQRLGYWHAELPKLGAERGWRVRTTWVTASAGSGPRTDVWHVPDWGSLHADEDDRALAEALEGMGIDSLGASWSSYLRQAFRGSDERFDVVIFSGNPFFYFSLAPFVKELWGAKVVLDFRDPFARNPRFGYTLEQRRYLVEFEDEVVRSADVVVSVNGECLASIAPGVSVRRRTVANGYDERAVDSVRTAGSRGRDGDLAKLMYCGTVFASHPLDDILDALNPAQYALHHFGRDYSASRAVRYHPAGRSHGVRPYSEVVGQLWNADAGLVVTGGELSTQTTKVFDYIGCDLEVIIVTKGVPGSGDLGRIVRGLEGVHWVRHEPDELAAFFREFAPSAVARASRTEYSRRAQTLRLLDVIGEIREAG